MARYLIPDYKLPELFRVVNKIRNKGANVTCDILRENIPVNIDRFGRGFFITCSEVEVEGSYRMNGWDFVGTIQHASPENIIRLADNSFEGRIPERYRTAERNCEHCNIRRDRNDTFLVYNEDEDEFRQVGRTCLKNYTQGLDAEVCASMISILAEIDRLNNLSRQGELDDDADMDYLERQSYVKYTMATARKKAYTYVVNHGYVPRQTGPNFVNALKNNENIPEASDEDVNAVTHWLQNARPSDWQRNALAAWTKPYFEPRDAGLITSAVSIYLRDIEQQRAIQNRRNAEDNSYAGEIGHKVTLTIDTISVAYYRQGGSYYHSQNYPVYRIVGTDGRIYSWGSTNTDLELNPGDILTGTVKAHKELRNGDRCTELTRCKVTGHQYRYRGFFD